ncbi:MAG TPA: hydroxyacid dehydrogenase, partial [Pseudonocardiaceae bacterium]|nr:hydroxyacid dehydrogenase [Pseudonocardiaceae bacterium]
MSERPRRPKVLLAMAPDVVTVLFDAKTKARLTEVAEVDFGLVVDDFGKPEALAALGDAELLLTCWGAPVLDADVLSAAPRLRAVVHAAGSIRGHVTEECWRRGLHVTSAAWANALPVAEYTVAMIVFANKRLLRIR